MSALPPPSLPPSAKPPGPFDRWRGVKRWKRWIASAVTGLVVIAVLGAIAGPDEPSSIRTVSDSSVKPTSTSTPTSTPASTDPTSTGTPTSTQPTTPVVPATLEPPTLGPGTKLVVPATVPAPSVPVPVDPVPVDLVPVDPGQLLATDVLAMIPIEREQGAGYNRELFGYGSPIDGFGCRTRALVLIRDSLTPPQIDRGGCAVVAGDWFSTYDALTWSDPGELEIDHVVALKEAWDSGANAWSAGRLEAFSNDLVDARTLRAVTGEVNQAKSDNDPTNWLPPAPDAVCGYLADWVSIKARWGLSMDQSEHGRIRNLLTDRCPGQTISPWADVPPASPSDPVAPLPAPPPVAPTAPPANGNCDPSYPGVCIAPSPPDLDCGDITLRRFEVLPPDPHRFDGDNNGIGCES